MSRELPGLGELSPLTASGAAGHSQGVEFMVCIAPSLWEADAEIRLRQARGSS